METASMYERYVLPTYARASLGVVRGRGVQVWDEQGRGYLDFCMGIAVCSLGHCHPVIIDAITKQANTLMHCSNLYYIPQQGKLAQFIVEKCVEKPGKVFFCNSGAEANDGMIKTARRYGHATRGDDGQPRTHIITFTQSFHGRTLGGIAATGQDKVKVGFDPIPAGFSHVEWGNLAALEAAIMPDTVAIMLEAVQGEGGVRVCTPDFLNGVVQLCQQHKLLLMVDEVQCGMGRCGEMMGWRAIAPEVQPDVVSWAKGLGGGFPIGAFWVSDRIIDDHGVELSSLMDAGSHGSTFGGNPMAVAVALATLNEIVESGLVRHVHETGEYVRDTISNWSHPVVSQVRGLGLLIGVGINADALNVPAGKMPASVVVDALRENGLLSVPAGPDTVRLLPPLNVMRDDVDGALAILSRTLNELKNS